MTRYGVCTVAMLLVWLDADVAESQRRTLRDIVVEVQEDVALTRTREPAFPNQSFEDILSLTDLIVQGTIGESVSTLTDDERDIYTTYEVLSPRVLYGASPQRSVVSRFGQAIESAPLRFRTPGGTVTIGGYSVTVLDNFSVTVSPGTEVLLLLEERDGSYWLADDVGAYDVGGSAARPLVAEQGVHLRVEGLDGDQLTRSLVLRRRAIEDGNGAPQN